MDKRACSPQQKKEIMERLYAVWINNPELRLGQLLYNAFPNVDIFYIEDEDFIQKLERRIDHE